MTSPDIERLVRRLDALLDSFESHPDPHVREGVVELVVTLRQLHAEGLKRLTDLLGEDAERFDRALSDPLVANLLLLYDLVMIDERQRAEAALEELRPLARSHGGDLQLLGVDDGIVTIRLLGACEGCPSSMATLREGIARALEARLPGFQGLQVEGPALDADRGQAPPASGTSPIPGQPASFVPAEKILQLERRLREGHASSTEPAEGPPRRVNVAPLDKLPIGALYGTLVDNDPVLVLRDGDGLKAYRNACPDSILPLHLGSLEGGVILCPWHGCCFDGATGARLEEEGPPLETLEVGLTDGVVWVELH
jgi:Fe-S cluster biogenesis protein NfuA/nitrite reductase/ring-hydroxylating ferredoxin subunit